MKHLLTVLCFIGAVLLYTAGIGTGAAVLLLAGVVLEGVFWFRVFRPKARE